MMTTNMRLTEGYTMLTEPLHTTGPFISYTRVTTLTMGARKEWSCEKNVHKRIIQNLKGRKGKEKLQTTIAKHNLVGRNKKKKGGKI